VSGAGEHDEGGDGVVGPARDLPIERHTLRPHACITFKYIVFYQVFTRFRGLFGPLRSTERRQSSPTNERGGVVQRALRGELTALPDVHILFREQVERVGVCRGEQEDLKVGGIVGLVHLNATKRRARHCDLGLVQAGLL
jgi:hypothetical protein